MRASALVFALVALVGCGSDAATRTETTGGGAAVGAPAPDGGLSVRDAIASDLDGPLMVRGYVISRRGEYRLCEAILESEPPQCGEPSLRVEGVDPTELRELSEARAPVSLLGDVEGDVLRVSETARG